MATPFDLATAVQLYKGLPQTQQDITRVTQALPQFEQQVGAVQKDVEMFVYGQLALQTLATVATFGIFLMLLHDFVKKQKRSGAGPFG